MLARIINGQLQYGLPFTGILLDGRTVSNYNLLPDNVLKAEGWLPVVENTPEISEDEYLTIDSFEDNGASIVINYKSEKY